MTGQLQMGDSLLTAYFQRYRDESDLTSLDGELLTALSTTVNAGSYFSELPLTDQFQVLKWHLELSAELSKQRGIASSINVHNALIEQEEDRRRFLKLLEKFDHSVTFEFTETYPMPPVSVANALLRELRELGHRSAIDDFGTGHSRLSLLTNCDFDVVKIDRSLTTTLARNPERKHFLKLILQYLEFLGKDHVVEGIEDESVHDFLVEIGFTKFQGYLFHRPVPVAGILDFASIEEVN